MRLACARIDAVPALALRVKALLPFRGEHGLLRLLLLLLLLLLLKRKAPLVLLNRQSLLHRLLLPEHLELLRLLHLQLLLVLQLLLALELLLERDLLVLRVLRHLLLRHLLLRHLLLQRRACGQPDQHHPVRRWDVRRCDVEALAEVVNSEHFARPDGRRNAHVVHFVILPGRHPRTSATRPPHAAFTRTGVPRGLGIVRCQSP